MLRKGQVVAGCFWSHVDALCWVQLKWLRAAALGWQLLGYPESLNPLSQGSQQTVRAKNRVPDLELLQSLLALSLTPLLG